MDNNQVNFYYTPHRIQKCLFGVNGSSSKRSLFQDQHKKNRDYELSGDESDLGPMSPLALTDPGSNSCNSTPEKQLIVQSMSPERSPVLDCCSMKEGSSIFSISSFSELKKITRAARYSPKDVIFSNSSNPLLRSPQNDISSQDEFASMTEIVPDTPERKFGREIQNGFINETPHKADTLQCRLITPLGTISKSAPLPKLHRRKASNNYDSSEEFSPERKENNLKRTGHDSSGFVSSKLFKSEENHSIPRARAALFQEKEVKSETELKDFKLSTKTFYNNTVKNIKLSSFNRHSISHMCNKRRSLPMQSLNHCRHSSKKLRWSGINAGVSHGIKKPKPKVAKETYKEGSAQKIADKDKSIQLSHSEQIKLQLNETKEKQAELSNHSKKKDLSPEVDLNKRFFKTNRTIQENNVATVTVSRGIKLKVINGKIALNEKLSRHAKNSHKRPKLSNENVNASSLTVDEPEIESLLEPNKMANILKVLEDDWAEDEYDTMEPLTNSINTISPLKSIKLPIDVTMSPASELSNMTSTMNIKDVSVCCNVNNVVFDSLQNNENNNISKDVKEKQEVKYYPLFIKGYSANREIDNSKCSRGVKRTAKWQLSAKGGAGEDQYQLDVGQKRFGANQCTECGVVYQLGDPDDENAHLNYHNSVRFLKFQGWKNERVIIEDTVTSSRIILIEPSDSKLYWKKVSEILAVVDRDLGLIDMEITDYSNKKIYLYIRNKSVLGVLVAEHINTAYRMIPELIELNCCTAESTPAKCGINVVWTVLSHRRQGIATKLVDILRAKFFYGYIMSLDDIAFSVPTPSGKIFAEKYTKTKNFKVYS